MTTSESAILSSALAEQTTGLNSRFADVASRFETTTGVVKLPDDDPAAVNALLEYLYGRDFSRPSQDNGHIGFKEDILLLIAVFHLAGKYLVQSLENLAETRFQAALQANSLSGYVPDMIDAVDDMTSDGADGADGADNLQKMLITRICASEQDVFGNPEKFKALHTALRDKPMLAYNAALAAAKSRTRKICYYCVSCKNYFDLPGGVERWNICPITGCGGTLI
ncbi:hypothetical protein B0A48_17759 [Cryoendolithus antarcticus]|uniref:BTB domain-containing protein n=1 Tax=Cryoendolithus antarcticus TaxID=1507870 RepID=A0A1V8S9W3_9PEZI|nr:hypothetical protein B0A48_17759 [Cryoendolithus antarcticus]